MNTCSFCKRPLGNGVPETWFTPDGQAVEICRSELPSAEVETSIGEVEICEHCYRSGLPSDFTPDETAEIHYQFGLDYRDRNELSRSVEALRKARELCETADIVAALAYAEDALGRGDVAITLHQRALEIDATHFMARENLKTLVGHVA